MRYHASAPPTTPPPSVAESQPRVCRLGEVLEDERARRGRARASAPPPTPRSMSRTRDGDVVTRVASTPAASEADGGAVAHARVGRRLVGVVPW